MLVLLSMVMVMVSVQVRQHLSQREQGQGRELRRAPWVQGARRKSLGLVVCM